MIMRTPNIEYAIKQAKEWGVAWGLCVVDGLYYVGDIKILKEFPIVIDADCEEVSQCS